MGGVQLTRRGVRLVYIHIHICMRSQAGSSEEARFAIDRMLPLMLLVLSCCATAGKYLYAYIDQRVAMHGFWLFCVDHVRCGSPCSGGVLVAALALLLTTEGDCAVCVGLNSDTSYCESV